MCGPPHQCNKSKKKILYLSTAFSAVQQGLFFRHPSELDNCIIAMSSSLRRLAQQVPKLSRSFQSGAPTKGAHGGAVEKGSHAEIIKGATEC